MRFAAFFAIMSFVLLGACEGEAEKAVRSKMLDPEAAQFRDVGRCTGDRDVWRGEVNGKNGFGAYTGFKPFFYSDYSVAFLEDSGFIAMMDRCYSDLEKDDKPTAAETQESSLKSNTPSPSLETGKTTNNRKLAAESFDPERGRSNERCWDDYCPCDTSNPDYGYLDRPLCRKIRMGVYVTDDEFSIGVQSRDARRALREFNESDRGYSVPDRIAGKVESPEKQGASRFPYVAPDGVDITSEEDERNWRRYGTTLPGSGE